MTTSETFWNGLPTTARRVVGTVRPHDPSIDPPHAWWAGFDPPPFPGATIPPGEDLQGERVLAVEVVLDGVNFGGGTVYLDDRDGSGWRKVTSGRGSPQYGHRELPLVDVAEVVYVPTWDYNDERYVEWLNGLLEHTPDSWDGDDAAESIATDFLAHVVGEVKRLGGCLDKWCGWNDDEPCDHGYLAVDDATDAFERRGTTEGAAMIAAERVRQLKGEAWSITHDDEHVGGELAAAGIEYVARGYALVHLGDGAVDPDAPPSAVWPWSADWWKPSEDPVRNLVKAGALIAAEVDRLLRKRSAEASR